MSPTTKKVPFAINLSSISFQTISTTKKQQARDKIKQVKNPFYLLSEAVLVVGGSGGSGDLKSSEVLLPSGGSRRCNVPDLPEPTYGGSLITKSTEIHFCGGKRTFSDGKKECYQLMGGAWTLQSQKF